MLGKELDRLLKGRFFQALNVKWQRKLGAPKPDESFYALYDRARALESREKQYSAGSEKTTPSDRPLVRGINRWMVILKANPLLLRQPTIHRRDPLVQVLVAVSAFGAMQLGI